MPTFYWLQKLHQNPYTSRVISNSSHCSTTILSKHITSALIDVKNHVIMYSETTFNNSNVNYFWSIKNSLDVIEKLRLRNCQGPQVTSFDFSTLCTPLQLDLILKQKCCLLLNGVSTESQKRTSVRQIRREFSPTRNMTRIQCHVGLALSYVKLLLSSWKTYMCNLLA